MSRDREEVMTLAVAILHANTVKDGLPLARSRQVEGLVNECFDLAEAMLDEQQRRYPAKKDA